MVPFIASCPPHRRVEPGTRRFVRKTFPALDLRDSETRFESLVLRSSLLSARRWKRGKIPGEAQGSSQPLRRKATTLRFDDPSHGRAGPPSLPCHCWLYLAIGWSGDAGHAGAGNACYFSRARLAGGRICLGAPADGAHSARGRPRSRRRVEGKGLTDHGTNGLANGK